MAEMSLYYGLVALVAILFLSKLLVSKPGGKGGLKLPPSPLALPIIGHLYLLKQPIHQFLTGLADQYGPIIFLRFGFRPVLVISSPAVAEEVFNKHDATFADRPLIQAFKHFGYDHTTLFAAPYGSHWRNLRRMTALQVFSTNRVSGLSSVREEELRVLLRKLLPQPPTTTTATFLKAEMKPILFELSFNTAMHMMTGKGSLGDDATSGSEEFMRIIEEVFSIVGGSNPEDFLPFLGWFGQTKLKKRMIRLEKEQDDAAQLILDEMKRDKQRAAATGRQRKETMLDSLLSMQETEPEYYTDQLIKGLIVTIIIGGGDTSAETAEWAIALLLNHPEVLKKLRSEIDAQVGFNRLVTDADLPNLPYLYSVIKETLRMFPAAPLLLPHQSTDECVVGGYKIPKGSMLLVNAYAIHRDPRVWPDPKEFRPERFAEEEKEGFRNIPFGVGRRRCPGEGMAKKFIALLLATMIQCFEWGREGKEPVDMTEGYGLTLPRANPLVLMYKPRPEMAHVLSQL